ETLMLKRLSTGSALSLCSIRSSTLFRFAAVVVAVWAEAATGPQASTAAHRTPPISLFMDDFSSNGRVCRKRPSRSASASAGPHARRSVHRGYSGFMRKLVVAGAAVLSISALLHAQDRLKSMSGYAQYLRMVREIPTSVKSGALAATWTADGRVLSYM